MKTATGFRLRRGVPYRRTVDDVRFALGINHLRADPLEVVVGIHTPHDAHTEHLSVGDVLELRDERWRVSAIVPGDRGTVDFEPATKDAT